MQNIYVVILTFAVLGNTATATFWRRHGHGNWGHRPPWGHPHHVGYAYGQHPYYHPHPHNWGFNQGYPNWGYPINTITSPPPHFPSLPNFQIGTNFVPAQPTATVGTIQQTINPPNTIGTIQQTINPPNTIGTNQQTINPPNTIGTNQQTINPPNTIGTIQQTIKPTHAIGTTQQTLLPSDTTKPNHPPSNYTSVHINPPRITPSVTTPVYQPVCGTNYETYENMDQFLSAQKSGKNIRIFLRRPCPSLGVGETKSIKVQCIASCYKSEDNQPICGSDDITYDNPAMLLCVQMCGYDVKVKHISPCRQVNNYTNNNPSISNGNDQTVNPLSPAVQISMNTFMDIIELCMTMNVSSNQIDYEQYCGYNIATLQNLLCTQNDNVNQMIITTPTPPPTPTPTTFWQPELVACVKVCPHTPEYNPVCGTNGITFENLSILRCVQLCGVSVNIHRASACSPAVDTQQTTNDENGEVQNVNNENKPVPNNNSSETIPSEVPLDNFGGVTKTTTEADETIDIDPRILQIANDKT
ncbi:uncharacterized protein LOC115440834 isoform X2 [Manduca sexta]|uniref:uncharacterized protein LOC115440834 isoform X2 n=1 Tax=Manduca sexta TaxID=7130 RepID=UPI00188EAC1C|nr:uncharacterized protein LOC115440834 isoform X2 [Manduca sexta]